MGIVEGLIAAQVSLSQSMAAAATEVLSQAIEPVSTAKFSSGSSNGFSPSQPDYGAVIGDR